MNFVQPIRDPDLVKDISIQLKEQNQRNYIMFLLGIYGGGLRISDILRLKVKDVMSRRYIILREKKTGKQKTIILNTILRRAIKEYIEAAALKPNDYLIKSREGGNQPLTRSMAYKILRGTAADFGLENIGTHTLRKTFGYHYYKQTHDIATLQKIFNHSDPSYTLRYIGIEQEQIDNTIDKFRI